MILFTLFSILFIVIGFILYHLIKNYIYCSNQLDDLFTKIDRLERLFYEQKTEKK